MGGRRGTAVAAGRDPPSARRRRRRSHGTARCLLRVRCRGNAERARDGDRRTRGHALCGVLERLGLRPRSPGRDRRPPMSPLEGVAVVAAGFWAGAINTIVGSGSLLTFPTLLAVGYDAVTANVSNTLGLVPGSVSGAIGYRRELKGQLRRVLTLVPAAVLGGLTGGILLLAAPGAFRDVVPFLILLAVALVLVQPLITRRRAAAGRIREKPGTVLHAGTFLTAVYGGYFGAAQGVILLALLGITIDDDLQRLNGVKNVVAAAGNGIAALFFLIFAREHIAWLAVVLLLVGSVVGGQVGAHFGRRIPAQVLRYVIAVVGTAVAIDLLVA